MLEALFWLAMCKATVSFERLPIENRPSVRMIESLLASRAVGNMTFTVRFTSATYHVGWHQSVVVDVDCQFDDRGVSRVNTMTIRIRHNNETESFLPLRKRK
ncbi:MAG: hypothetical protein L0Y71_20900 [Gemmataceae bacterium]|nr:hypothetical protein [Gemmataceae bacterium]